MNCQRCGERYPKDELGYYQSEGGFFPSGWYCEDCYDKVRDEEDQINDMDK